MVTLILFSFILINESNLCCVFIFSSNISSLLLFEFNSFIFSNAAFLSSIELSESLIIFFNDSISFSLLSSDSALSDTRSELSSVLIVGFVSSLILLLFEINSLIPSKIYKSELNFSINVDESIPKGFRGDAHKIYKIVTYIILNAIDYTNYGEVKLTVGGKMIKEGVFEFNFVVQNSGHAMTREVFNRDFNDFVNIENAQSNNMNSIELGIIIAKQLIKIMHGKIKFINERGKGTRYEILVRQKVTNAEMIGNIFTEKLAAHEKNKSLIDLTGKTVLVVDDAEINIKLASRYLEQYNLNIVTASSGQECVDKVKTTRFDIIFLDKLMPGMDGNTTLKALNALGIPLPPIIVLTANVFDGSKETFVAEGYSDYLNKPIIFRELNKIINKYFAEKDGDF